MYNESTSTTLRLSYAKIITLSPIMLLAIVLTFVMHLHGHSTFMLAVVAQPKASAGLAASSCNDDKADIDSESASRRLLKRATKALETSDAPEGRSRLLSQVAEAYAATNRFERSIELLDSLDNDYWVRRARRALSTMKSREGSLESALKQVRRIDIKELRVAAYCDVAKARSVNDHANGANTALALGRATIERISDDVSKARAYAILADTLFATGDRASGQEALRDAKNAIRSLSGHRSGKQGAIARIAMVEALYEDLQGAKHTIALMASKSRQVAALTEIARAMAMKKQADAAKEMLGHAIETAGSIEIAFAKSQAYYSIGAAQLDVHDKESSRDSLALARNAASHISDVDMRAQVYAEVAFYKGLLGEVDAARETLTEIDEEILDKVTYYRDRVYSGIVIGHCRKGKIQSAIENAAKIGRIRERDSAFHHVVRAQVEAGDIQAAFDIVSRIEGARLRVKSYIEIASSDDSEDSPEYRDKALLSAFGEAVRVSDALQRSDIYRKLGVMYARLGRVQEMNGWGQSIANGGDRASAYLGGAEELIGRE